MYTVRLIISQLVLLSVSRQTSRSENQTKDTKNTTKYKQIQFTWDMNGMWIRVYGLISLMRTCVRMFRSRSITQTVHTQLSLPSLQSR